MEKASVCVHIDMSPYMYVDLYTHTHVCVYVCSYCIFKKIYMYTHIVYI